MEPDDVGERDVKRVGDFFREVGPFEERDELCDGHAGRGVLPELGLVELGGELPDGVVAALADVVDDGADL